jgi:hypothetical protein
MNSNYHMSEFMVKERIQIQQQTAAAHRLARLAANPKPAAPGVHQWAAAGFGVVTKSIFAAISFGGGLVRDAFAVKTAVR